MNMAGAKYTFCTLAHVDQQIGTLLTKATALGIKQKLLDALRTSYRRLRRSPEKLGNPAHDTRKEGGTVFNAIVEPISLHYVVYRIEKVVILLNVKPLARFFPD